MKKIAGVALVTQLSVVSASAWGADVPSSVSSAGQSDDLAEITVTALRRSERLEEVPASITAISAQQIFDQGITTPSDLVGLVPNLQVSTTVGEGIPIFSLRGVSMSDYSFNQQGPIATYYDEVYKGSFPFLGLDLYDIERVEVLRGPQGTLYGKNTTGGAINIISKGPTFDTEGYLSVGAGNYDRREANGAIQAALSDTVAARIAFTYADADGWMHNILPGSENPNGVRQWGVRASLLYRPNDSLDVTLRLSASEQDPINYGVYARPGPYGIGNGVYAAYGLHDYFRTGLNPYDIQSNYVQDRLQKTANATLTTSWKLDSKLTLTSVTSTDFGRLFVPEDGDGSPLSVLQDQIAAVGRQLAEDIRLTSDYDGGLNYILGLYLNREQMSSGTTFDFFTDVPVAACQADLVGCISRNHFDQTKITAATYADLNYTLNDRVTLRGGIRYTHDTGSINNFTAQLANADGTGVINTIPGNASNIDATTSKGFSTNEVTGKVGVDFKPAPGWLLYASGSRGYRASAFNAQAYFQPSELNVAKPEIVNAYEVGMKVEISRKSIFNVAAFYYDYSNQQALSISPTTAVQTLINIPKSRIAGGELEFTQRLLNALDFHLGIGLLDTRIQAGEISGIDISGHRLPNAPAASLTMAVNWDILATDRGTLKLALSGNLNTKQYFELMNENSIAQPTYALLNGDLSFRTANDHIGVSLWSRNLLNRFYVQSAIDLSSFGFDYFHLGEPRTYGVNVEARF